jgi:hypothetical protein
MMRGIGLGLRMIGGLGSGGAFMFFFSRNDVDDARRILSMDMLKFEGYIQIHDGEDARWSNPNISMLNS